MCLVKYCELYAVIKFISVGKVLLNEMAIMSSVFIYAEFSSVWITTVRMTDETDSLPHSAADYICKMVQHKLLICCVHLANRIGFLVYSLRMLVLTRKIRFHSMQQNRKIEFFTKLWLFCCSINPGFFLWRHTTSTTRFSVILLRKYYFV